MMPRLFNNNKKIFNDYKQSALINWKFVKVIIYKNYSHLHPEPVAKISAQIYLLLISFYDLNCPIQ